MNIAIYTVSNQGKLEFSGNGTYTPGILLTACIGSTLVKVPVWCLGTFLHEFNKPWIKKIREPNDVSIDDFVVNAPGWQLEECKYKKAPKKDNIQVPLRGVRQVIDALSL